MMRAVKVARRAGATPPGGGTAGQPNAADGEKGDDPDGQDGRGGPPSDVARVPEAVLGNRRRHGRHGEQVAHNSPFRMDGGMGDDGGDNIGAENDGARGNAPDTNVNGLDPSDPLELAGLLENEDLHINETREHSKAEHEKRPPGLEVRPLRSEANVS